MQCIVGGNSSGSFVQVSNILPWQGWDEWHHTDNYEADSDIAVQNQSDVPNRLQITLVTLRSTKLASAVSPSFEISADDLLTVNSAASCFSKLCEEATTKSEFDALFAILGEWEALFRHEQIEDASADPSDSGVNWSDDWGDEGWVSFETVEKEKKDSSLSIHPLHACWLAIFKKLVMLSQYGYLLRTMDQSIRKPNGLLINEDETHSSSEMLLESDCYLALKFALLLPYEAVQLHCLDALEQRLRQGGILDPEDIKSNGFELLILVLFSGAVSTIISKHSYGATTSYLCYLLGCYSRACQDQLLRRDQQSNDANDANNEEECYHVFRKLLSPFYISELVKADQQLLAGVLVGKFMHTNPSLSLINVAEATLRRYLKMQLRALEVDSSDSSYETLGNCISCLKGKLKGLLDSALSSLPSPK